MTFHCPFCKVNVNVLGMRHLTTHPFLLKFIPNGLSSHEGSVYKYYQCVRCKIHFARHRLGEWIYIKNDDEWIVLQKPNLPIEVGTPVTFKYEGHLIYKGSLK